MRIVIISDTHQKHTEFEGLEGDVLIHCGDMFDLFDEGAAELAAMDRWFGEQNFGLVLCTGGNHDRPLEAALQRDPQPFRNAVYLQDAGYEHRGRVFWGAPWVPDLPGHAFFATGYELEHKWSLIPPDIDMLITHSPPRSVLDRSSSGHEFGCVDLLDAVHRVKPKVHCFGHVHNSRGRLQHGGTTFVNASSVMGNQRCVLEPIVVEL